MDVNLLLPGFLGGHLLLPWPALPCAPDFELPPPGPPGTSFGVIIAQRCSLSTHIAPGAQLSPNHKVEMARGARGNEGQFLSGFGKWAGESRPHFPQLWAGQLQCSPCHPVI